MLLTSGGDGGDGGDGGKLCACVVALERSLIFSLNKQVMEEIGVVETEVSFIVS